MENIKVDKAIICKQGEDSENYQPFKKLVNEKIAEGLAVVTEEMSIEDAKKKGAMALFGEKYGESVRVVSMGDFSMELCGGTHVQNTADIAFFKILSESGVAAGVRRIEALTGANVMAYYKAMEENFLNAVNAAKAAGAKICGVDMMLEDYRDENTNYAIIELNFNPAIHIHSYPYKGKERKIATHVLKLLELV